MPVYDPLDSDVQPSFEQLSKLKKQNKNLKFELICPQKSSWQFYK